MSNNSNIPLRPVFQPLEHPRDPPINLAQALPLLRRPEDVLLCGHVSEVEGGEGGGEGGYGAALVGVEDSVGFAEVLREGIWFVRTLEESC